MTIFFFLFIGVGMLATFQNWRRGFLFMIAVAAIQDPIRKLTPGTPGYYVLASLPIWGVMVLNLLTHKNEVFENFRVHNPRLYKGIKFLIVTVTPATFISATYGEGSWQYTLLGLFAFGCPILGFVLGFIYVDSVKDLEKLMIFYCIVTGVALSGVYFEEIGLFSDWNAIGTKVFNTFWIRQKSGGLFIKMKSGFYRSPDIMGWHASVLTMMSLGLALVHQGTRRYLWLALSCWGGFGLMVCGRRKMFMMIPIFGLILVLIWLKRNPQFMSIVIKFVMPVVVFAIIGYSVYQRMGINRDISTYYFTDIGDVFYRVKSHGWVAVVSTLRGDAGFFGLGLGFANQGGHHIRADKPRTWQEGGLSKIAAEVGVIGLFGFFILALSMMRTHVDNVNFLVLESKEANYFAVFIALFVANSASFVVSGQIFGDPFIVSYFSFLTGIALGASRFRESAVEDSTSEIVTPTSANVGEQSPRLNRRFIT